MHEPDYPPNPACASAREPESRRRHRMGRDRPPADAHPRADSPSDEMWQPTQEEAERLRFALRMVLDLDVFDSAGRAVTVERMLRGYVATAVRVALEGKRSG